MTSTFVMVRAALLGAARATRSKRRKNIDEVLAWPLLILRYWRGEHGPHPPNASDIEIPSLPTQLRGRISKQNSVWSLGG